MDGRTHIPVCVDRLVSVRQSGESLAQKTQASNRLRNQVSNRGIFSERGCCESQDITGKYDTEYRISSVRIFMAILAGIAYNS